MAPDHYAQCPVRNSTNWPANGPVFCLCYLIAKVEAEVRERLRAEAMNLPSRVELDEVGNEVTWVRYADLLDGESDE